MGKSVVIAADGVIKCPFADSVRTYGSGFAVDHVCTKVVDPQHYSGYRVTSGYVEWERDVNPVPLWCPIMDKEEQVFKILESD